jgi:signal transduction histidine kinase
MLRTVRDLAQGLRPSMLDDFGLQPALEWLVRDFRRRGNVRVDLSVYGDISALPDPHRTCAYRVVQEALTNGLRHAGATTVSVSVTREGRRVQIGVVDDGVGFDPDTPRQGLGLVGIEERVRDLHGVVTIHSRPGRGVQLAISLPLAAELPEAPVARAAS